MVEKTFCNIVTIESTVKENVTQLTICTWAHHANSCRLSVFMSYIAFHCYIHYLNITLQFKICMTRNLCNRKVGFMSSKFFAFFMFSVLQRTWMFLIFMMLVASLIKSRLFTLYAWNNTSDIFHFVHYVIYMQKCDKISKWPSYFLGR
jgi:hypothetical protein